MRQPCKFQTILKILMTLDRVRQKISHVFSHEF